MRRLIVIISFLLYSGLSWSQEDPSNILSALTKDLVTGEVMPLIDRMDSDVSYIIDASQFWCAPCNAGIRRLLSIKTYLKETYNVEVIILEDEHWDDTDLALEKKADRNWDFNLYALDSNFDFFGVDSYPTYYFVPAGFSKPTAEGLSTNCTILDAFLKRELRRLTLTPQVLTNMKQTTTSDCLSANYLEINPESTQHILGEQYIEVDKFYLREDSLTGNIYKYYPFPTLDSLYLDFTMPICSKIDLRDIEGDILSMQVTDIYQKEGREHRVMNKMIETGCGDEIPFEIITGLGTNAGLLFDIEGYKIVSRLVCHTISDSLVYQDEAIDVGCITSSIGVPLDDKKIKLYPNPTSKSLTLELFWPDTTTISIRNTQGQDVLNIITTDQVLTLDIEYLPVGLYYLTLENDDTKQTQKLVKY